MILELTTEEATRLLKAVSGWNWSPANDALAIKLANATGSKDPVKQVEGFPTFEEYYANLKQR